MCVAPGDAWGEDCVRMAVGLDTVSFGWDTVGREMVAVGWMDTVVGQVIVAVVVAVAVGVLDNGK